HPLRSLPTRRSSDLAARPALRAAHRLRAARSQAACAGLPQVRRLPAAGLPVRWQRTWLRSVGPAIAAHVHHRASNRFAAVPAPRVRASSTSLVGLLGLSLVSSQPGCTSKLGGCL